MGRVNLINARKDLKMSHDVIASKAGISRAYYTQIENGYKKPSIDVAERIARILDKKVDELFCDSE